MSDWRYAPDLPPDTPNIWTACDGFHPDVYGNYRTGWLPASFSGFSLVTGAGVGFQFGFAYTGGVLLISQGTSSSQKYYVYNGSTWNDRYAAGLTAGAQFYPAVQVGNTTLLGASNTTGLMYRDITGTNNFASVSSSPKAGVLVVSPLNIVVAFDTSSDGWATSDTNAPTTWSGGEAASGNLRQTTGTMRAAALLGNDVIAFKERGVYRGQYVGGTLKWIWNLIDPRKGAWGPGCAVSANEKVYFLGAAGFYSFDGSSFNRLDSGVWRELISTFGNAEGSVTDYNTTNTKMVWDQQSGNIFIFGLANINTLTDGLRWKNANVFYTYNVFSNKWGYQSRLSEDASGSFPAVFDVSSLNSYVSSGLAANTDVGVFSVTDDKVEALTTSFNATDLPGTNYKPKLRTYRLGQRNKLTSVTRFTPEWTKSDGAGTDLSTATVKTVTPYTSNAVMASETAGTAATLSSNQYRADYTVTAPFQSAEININCEAMISGGIFDSQGAGTI